MCVLAKYKNMFGIPGEGIRKYYRILNISMIDVLVVLLIAFLLSTFVFKQLGFLKTSLCLFILGIFAHRLFCVRTTVDKALFRD